MRVPALVLAATVLASSVAHAESRPTIALVHGAFETAAVWEGVAAKLRADGYSVVVPDLPGRDNDGVTPDKVTLAGYAAAVNKAVEGKGKVVLVGHSFGGIVISAAAEAQPLQVKRLVYVAAYLPRNGDSLLSLATSDVDAKIGPALTIDKVHGIASVAQAARGGLFANDASVNVQSVVARAVVDEPLGPLATPVVLDGKFSLVPKTYVHTSMDLVVSPTLQARMVANVPVEAQAVLNTGHTPFVTDVAGLTKAIEDAAR